MCMLFGYDRRRTLGEVLLRLEALAAGAAGDDGLALAGLVVQLLPALSCQDAIAALNKGFPSAAVNY